MRFIAGPNPLCRYLLATRNRAFKICALRELENRFYRFCIEEIIVDISFFVVRNFLSLISSFGSNFSSYCIEFEEEIVRYEISRNC